MSSHHEDYSFNLADTFLPMYQIVITHFSIMECMRLRW
jgi:hypothetical protein